MCCLLLSQVPPETSAPGDYPRDTGDSRHLSSPLDSTLKQVDHPRGDKPHPHHRERPRDGDRGMHEDGPPRHNMPQYPPYQPYPQYPGYSGYPMYPGPHAPPYPTPHPHGFTPSHQPPPHQRYGQNQRGTKRSYTDRDDLNWRQESDTERSREKRAGDEKIDERPRILTKQKHTQPSTEDSAPEVTEDKDNTMALQRTTSSSSETAHDHDTPKHVTFLEETGDSAGSPTLDEQSSQAPARRAPQRKVMLRKLGDQEGDPQGENSDQQQTRSAAKKSRPKDIRNVRGDDKHGEGAGEDTTPDADSTAKHMAWSTKERGPINTSKTLYEPEGRKSEVKFLKYQAQTRDSPRGRTGSRGSQGSTTPTGEIEASADVQKSTEVKDTKGESSSEVARQSQSPENVGGASRIHPDQKKGHSERTHHQELEKPSSHTRSQHEGKRAFPERAGPYREEHPRHEPRRGDRPRHDTQRQDRTGPTRKQDTGGYERQKDFRHDSKPGRERRNEDKHHTGPKRETQFRDREDSATSRRAEWDQRTGTPEQKPGTVEPQTNDSIVVSQTSVTGSKPEESLSDVTQSSKDQEQKDVSSTHAQEGVDQSQQPSTAPNEQVQRDRRDRDSKQTGKHQAPQRTTAPPRRGERVPRTGRYPPRDREEVQGGEPRGERPARPHRPKQQSGRSDWSDGGKHEGGEGRRYLDTKKGEQ